MLRHRLAAGFAFAWLASVAPAGAADCGERTGYSACLDANALWLRDGRWFSIARTNVAPAGRVDLALAGEGLFRPLTLRVPGPAPEGNDVRLVDYRFDATTLLSFGIHRALGLELALPVVLHQKGAGNQGVTAQSGDPLEPSTERDPRVGARYALLSSEAAWGLAPRLELALPLGDGSAYAGADAFTLAPGISAEARARPFAFGADVAARLRPSTALGAARLGSALLGSLGLSADLIPERLALSAESFVSLSLVETTSEAGRELGSDLALLPAEWLASARYRPLAGEGWFVAAGAGSALPLSSESSASSEELGSPARRLDGEREWFAGPTSPLLRVVLVLGYAAGERADPRAPLRKRSPD